MAGPKILMLDEPSLGLAPLLVDEMFRVVEEINQKGVTVILVEQNTEHALRIASRGFALAAAGRKRRVSPWPLAPSSGVDWFW